MTNWEVFRDPQTQQMVYRPTKNLSAFAKFMALNPYFTLVLNWLSGFKLGSLTILQKTNLLKLLKKRQNCNIVIHGLWMGTANRSYDLDVDKVPNGVFLRVEQDLLDILKSDQALGAFLFTNWFNILDWEDIDWNSVLISKENWPVYRDHFQIIVYQYVKHAMVTGMSILDYILKCKQLFHKVENVDIACCFYSQLSFVSNKKRCSLLNFCPVTTVNADKLRFAFSKQAPNNAIPCLCFKTYLANAPQGRLTLVGRICCLAEVKIKFDQNLEMVNEDVMYQCDLHQNVFDSHLCVVFNHFDRFTLHEDTVI